MKDQKPQKDEETDDEIDVVIEDEDETNNPLALVKKLREKLKTAEKDKLEYLTGWQKAKADFINLRKRDEEMKEGILKYAKEDVLLQIIPVLDSFQLAFSNTQVWESISEDWRKGVESIYNQLVSVLEQNGVVQENPIGKTFDPKHSEAVGVIVTNKKDEDGKVLEVLQVGYNLNGKSIRSSKVRVGEFVSKE